MSMSVNLINWSPAAGVALLGLVIALLPVAWVARRVRQEGLTGWPAWQRVLTVATLFLTIDLVVFGAFTRLTDSGLGCPDWPGCYGETSPFGAHAAITAAQSLAPTGPVSHPKAWIEMVHRYLATGVGALITGLMALAWRGRRELGALSPWWATATFVWVCAQGAFGALTVTLKLQPIIVSTHLLGALLGVGLLAAQVRVLEVGASGQSGDRLPWVSAWAASPWRSVGKFVLALVVVQAALGAWVSTNYAVLACTEVPLCQGQWWPDMDFAMGFHLLRPLGGDGQGAYITQAALTAIHVTHRMAALVVVLAVLGYGVALIRWRFAGHDASANKDASAHPWRTEGRWLCWLTAWQVASGLSNVVLGWPLAAALAHTLGAALLVWRLTRLLVLPRQYAGVHAARSGR
jgi:cytochrome c oxidase assembly protein subunit 15